MKTNIGSNELTVESEERKRKANFIISHCHQKLSVSRNSYCYLVLIMQKGCGSGIKASNLAEFLRQNSDNDEFTIQWYVGKNARGSPSDYHTDPESAFHSSIGKRLMHGDHAFHVKTWCFKKQSYIENDKSSDIFETALLLYGFERNMVKEIGLQCKMINQNFKFQGLARYLNREQVQNLITLGRTQPLLCFKRCTKEHQNSKCNFFIPMYEEYSFNGNLHIDPNVVVEIQIPEPSKCKRNQQFQPLKLTETFPFVSKNHKNEPQWDEDNLSAEKLLYIQNVSSHLTSYSKTMVLRRRIPCCYLLLVLTADVAIDINEKSLIDFLIKNANDDSKTIHWYIGKCFQPNVSKYHTSPFGHGSNVRRRLQKGDRVFRVKFWTFNECAGIRPHMYEKFESFVIEYGIERNKVHQPGLKFLMMNTSRSLSIIAQSFGTQEIKQAITVAQTCPLLCLKNCKETHELKDVPLIGGHRFCGNLHLNSEDVKELTLRNMEIESVGRDVDFSKNVVFTKKQPWSFTKKPPRSFTKKPPLSLEAPLGGLYSVHSLPMEFQNSRFKEITNLPAGSVFLKLGDTNISIECVHSLLPDQQVDDLMMDSLLQMIEHESRTVEGMTPCLVLKTSPLQLLFSDPEDTLPLHLVNEISENQTSTIIVPIHLLSMNHWIVVVGNQGTRGFEIFDPLQHDCTLGDYTPTLFALQSRVSKIYQEVEHVYESKKTDDLIRKELENKLFKIKQLFDQGTGHVWASGIDGSVSCEWPMDIHFKMAARVAKQKDGHSCGVLAVAFVEQVVGRKRITPSLHNSLGLDTLRLRLFDELYHFCKTGDCKEIYESRVTKFPDCKKSCESRVVEKSAVVSTTHKKTWQGLSHGLYSINCLPMKFQNSRFKEITNLPAGSVFFKLGDTNISIECVHSLLPDQQVDDLMMDSLLQMIEHESRTVKGMTPCLVLKTSPLQVLFSDPEDTLPLHLVNQISNDEANIIIVPLHVVSMNHWIVVVCSRETRDIQIFDPLQHDCTLKDYSPVLFALQTSHSKVHMQVKQTDETKQTDDLIRKEIIKKLTKVKSLLEQGTGQLWGVGKDDTVLSEWLLNIRFKMATRVAKQKDGNSCGILAIAFVEQVVGRKRITPSLHNSHGLDILRLRLFDELYHFCQR